MIPLFAMDFLYYEPDQETDAFGWRKLYETKMSLTGVYVAIIPDLRELHM
jgi:hypothetical protein